MYDLIIIGAGPAGLTSAIYAARANKKTLVLEAKSYGGSIINTLDIENYPANMHITGYDFAMKLYKQVKELGVTIKLEKAIAIRSYIIYLLWMCEALHHQLIPHFFLIHFHFPLKQDMG